VLPELSIILGTEEGCNWQYAGNTSFKDANCAFELKDLTGFEGRCDAIYCSTEKPCLPPIPWNCFRGAGKYVMEAILC
jgi:hypothetical protein